MDGSAAGMNWGRALSHAVSPETMCYLRKMRKMRKKAVEIIPVCAVRII